MHRLRMHFNWAPVPYAPLSVTRLIRFGPHPYTSVSFSHALIHMHGGRVRSRRTRLSPCTPLLKSPNILYSDLPGAQRAAREEDGEEEEGVPEDESLPPRGGATCPHPHRGGGQIENIV